MSEFMSGVLGAGFGYMLSSAVDRYTATHALDANNMDTPAAGQIYNSEAVDLPIWSSWQRIAGAVASVAVPLFVASRLSNPAAKSFFQIAGFAAVARGVGKAGDDAIAMLSGGASAPALVQQLYAPEIAADAKLTGSPSGLTSIQPGTFGSLPALTGMRPPPPVGYPHHAYQLAPQRMMARQLGGPASNVPMATATYANFYMTKNITSDPATAGVMGYLTASGQYPSSTPVGQLLSIAQGLVAQGLYAPDANGLCQPGDLMTDSGLCQRTAPPPPAGASGGSPPPPSGASGGAPPPPVVTVTNPLPPPPAAPPVSNPVPPLAVTPPPTAPVQPVNVPFNPLLVCPDNCNDDGSSATT